LNNTPTATTGKVNGGANFASASSQSISLGTDASLNPAAITVSAWVKGTSFPNAYNAVFAKVSFGATAFHEILIKSNGKLAMVVRGAGTVLYDGTGSNTLSAGTFYYVTLVYSSAVGLIGYVNASVDGTASANGALASNTGDSTIANDTNTFGRFFNGVVDEVRGVSGHAVVLGVRRFVRLERRHPGVQHERRDVDAVGHERGHELLGERTTRARHLGTAGLVGEHRLVRLDRPLPRHVAVADGSAVPGEEVEQRRAVGERRAREPEALRVREAGVELHPPEAE